MFPDELPEQEDLLLEPRRVGVFGQEIAHLIPEDRRAARLEDDDRNARLDGYSNRLQQSLEHPFGERKQAVVVQRTSAADRRSGHDDVKAGGLEQVDGGDRRLRVKVIVE